MRNCDVTLGELEKLIADFDDIRRRIGPDPKGILLSFWTKVTIVDECWEWTGAVNGRGYGSFWPGGRHPNGKPKLAQAHRYAYEQTVGPIPPGLHIDHLCVNPSCVRPAHLEPVTPRENTQRGVARRRAKRSA